METAILIALTIVLPLVVALLRGPVAQALRARAAHDRYALAAAKMADAVADVVADVHQQVVSPARELGVWDDEAKARAKTRAVEALKKRWSSAEWKWMRIDLGVDVKEMAEVLEQKVEGGVLGLKRS
jgi:hypothetical protein